MGISIHITRSGADLDMAFRLRHQVYVVEEERFLPRPDERIYDRYDAYRGTTTLIARDDGKPGRPCIGTMRFATLDDVGLPTDNYYDFSGVIAARQSEGRFATMGMLAVLRRYRAARGLLLGLCKVAWRELRRIGVRFIIAPCSPDTELFLSAMGAQKVGETFMHGDPPVQMTPLLLDMEKITPTFREASIDPHHILFEELSERRLFRKGEAVIRQGELGHEAFLVMRGTARVVIGGVENPYLLGPGDLFGEIALLDESVRINTVVAQSKQLDVAVIPRNEFQARLSSDIEFAQSMLRIIARRLRSPHPELPLNDLAAVNKEQMTALMVLQASLDGDENVNMRWLASDTGLERDELLAILDRWEDAGVVRRQEDGSINVLDPGGLQAVADHLEAGFELSMGIIPATDDI